LAVLKPAQCQVSRRGLDKAIALGRAKPMIHIVDLVEHHHCRHRDPLSGPAAGPFSAASASHARRYDFAMLGADTFRPDQWHDFFITVAGAAAVLTGLVFVALSLNLGAVIPDPTHRYRAIGTLSNFAGIFVLCTFAFAGTVYVSGYLRARSKGGRGIQHRDGRRTHANRSTGLGCADTERETSTFAGTLVEAVERLVAAVVADPALRLRKARPQCGWVRYGQGTGTGPCV
jgi:hypothetical protein